MGMLGAYITETSDGYNVLCNNSKEVHRSGKSLVHQYGVRTDDTKVLIDNSNLAEGISTCELHDGENGLCAGKATIENSPYTEIGNEDYSSLVSGDTAPGYAVLDPDTQYSIKDVSLEHNVETVATFTKQACPRISFKYVETRINKNGYLIVPYFVDTHYADGVNRNVFNDTFTVIITDENGQELYKRTHYAGEHTAVIGPFSLKGEHWIEMRAIDQDGCGSPSVFCDFLVEDPQEDVVYQITMADLRNYDILTADDTQGYLSSHSKIKAADEAITIPEEKLERRAYINKLGFTQLFADKKAYGSVLRLPANLTFNITYHLNRKSHVKDDAPKTYATPSNRSGEIELSTIKYFKVLVDDGTRTYTEVNQLSCDEFFDELMENLWSGWTTKVNWGNDKYLFGERNSSDTAFTGKYYILDKVNGQVPSSVSSHPLNSLTTEEKARRLMLNPQRTSAFPVVGSDVAGHIGGNGSVTPVDLSQKGHNGYLYVMYITNVNGASMDQYDYIKFPDNVTIDMNGCTFKATDSTMRWKDGAILYLYKNNNTKVINGNVVGLYQDYIDPAGAAKWFMSAYGTPTYSYRSKWDVQYSVYKLYKQIYTPAEGQGSIWVTASRNTVFKNMNLRDAMGYDPSFTSTDYIDNYPKYKTYSDANIESVISAITSEFSATGVPSALKSLLADFPYDSLRGENTRTMSVSEMKSITRAGGDDIDKQEFCLRLGGGIGNCLHYGTTLHCFVLLYNSNGVLKKIVKSVFGYHIRASKTYTKFRTLVYGRVGNFTNGYPDTGGNFPPNDGPSMTSTICDLNNMVDECRIEHSRTCIVHPNWSCGVTYRNCTFRNIATSEVETECFSVTPYFGDLEEGCETIERVSLINCHNEMVEGEPGKSLFTFHVSGSCIIQNCTNVSPFNAGLLTTFFLINSRMPVAYIPLYADRYNTHIIIRNCRIGKSNEDKVWFSKQGFNLNVQYRIHRPKTEEVITMSDTVIDNRIMYNNFNFHRVKNGKQIFD